VIGKKISENKLLGISESELNQIRNFFNITIFECDGAKNKPLKVHTDYDPVVPDFATNVIIIIGADVVNTKIEHGYVHRPEMFCKAWNVTKDKIMEVDFIVKVASSEQGYLSKIKHNVILTYFINKADEHRDNAEKLARAIYYKTNRPTFFGSVRKNFIEQVG
jgi:probable selenium-dependent hydroxylase accessory protein YqeC